MTAVHSASDGAMTDASDIVAAARAWRGTPFHHGAALRGVGCDCLGLVRGLWRELYGEEAEDIAPYRADWLAGAAGERLREGLARHLVPLVAGAERPGDVLLLRWRRDLPASHLAVLTGPRTMVHAHPRTGVCEVALVPAWISRRAGGFRFPARRDAAKAAETAQTGPQMWQGGEY